MKKITVMLFVLSLFGLLSTLMISQTSPNGMPKQRKATLQQQKAPFPTVSFAAPTATPNEITDCSYTDYDYPVLLDMPASQDATVTFTVTPGSATELLDYEVITTTANFVAGTTTTQNLTIRVFNDGLVEGPEDFNVNMTLNANGGDAVLDPATSDMAITIIDDDFAPATETVQDTENTATAYNVAVTSTGTVHAKDALSGNIMLSLTNNDAFDYGCTSVAVTRDAVTAGAPAVDFGTNTALNFQVMAKVFKITPAIVNPTGSVTNTFYFTETEISDWEAATGNLRTDLKVIKLGETTYSNAIIGTYGTDVTLRASSTTGADGEYYFGIDTNPTISFDSAIGSAIEDTNCLFTDVTFPISILNGASQDAEVTFSVTGGTATDLVDYEIIPASVTFLAGDTTPQNLTVRVYHDGLVEGGETINVTTILNANGGDAVLDATKQDMVITITDDDVLPTTELVQDSENTATAYNVAVTSAGTLYATDTASGNIMLSLTNNDIFDYGCTTVAVSRDAVTAGAPAVNFGTNTDIREQVLAKVYTVTTVNPNPTGNVDYTFYFTEAEITAWETATGRTRGELKVIKSGDTTYTPATIGAYGTEVTLTATFAAGAAGDYHFGIDLEPTISFDSAIGSANELTDCNFTDVTFPISIETGASADAEVTFSVTGGTATDLLDYQIIPASVTFLAGDTTPQDMTVRVFHDGLVEGDETINVTMVLNANGGDAVLDITKQDMVITITDDDVAPIAATPIQDVVNTATPYTAAINATGTAYATDSATANVMLSLTESDNFDYGCTTVAVSRDAVTAGAPSVDFGTNTALNLQVMAKVFSVTTANANATGSADYTFYFTETEIADWETATGNVRADLKVIKLGETIYSNGVLGTFGATGVTLTTTIATGLAGDYHFGIDSNPTISFDNATGTATEDTNCAFTDVTFPISILNGASADAEVTFNVTGGTATQGLDFDFSPLSVTFLAGDTTPQNMTVRVYHDGLVEGDETINVSLVLNANGGDAVLDATKQDMVITISDDDLAPTTELVQDTENTATAYNVAVTSTGTVYATDSTSGNIMLSLTNNDAFDYGCTTVAVSRDAVIAGAPSVDFGTNTATNLQVLAKVFSVSTANANLTGNVDYTFYFTEAEIAAWETATGNVRGDLKVVKLGETTYTPATIGVYGTDVTLTASFAAGASGDYHFGVTLNPMISFDAATGIATEDTNCNFTDVTFPISIDGAASADADITFMLMGGTATASDYQIIPSTVTFTAGSLASQNLTVRVFHDGLVEGAETLNLMMVLNANGGDATLDATKQDIAITINDDDLAPAAGGIITVLTEDFEGFEVAIANGWTQTDQDGDGLPFIFDPAFDGTGDVEGTSAFSITDTTIFGGPGPTNPNNYLFSPQITIPAGVSASSLSYVVGAVAQDGISYQEHYSVYFTTDITDEASIQAGVVLENDREIPALGTEIRTHDMTAYAGQTGYLVFRHHNTAGNGILIFDTVDLTATTSGAVVQVGVNTPTAYNASIPAENGTAYATDSATGDIMLSLDNNDAFDYGCTTVFVSRDQVTAGAPSVDFGGNTAANLRVMAKTFDVAANANASGNVGFTFYLKESEVAAWETATGLNRSELKVVKTGETTYYPVTLGSFGSDVTVTTTVTTGAPGTYNFGADPALGTNTFELNNSISIYPNPTKDVLNISTTAEFGLPSGYSIYSALGQILKSVNHVTERDLTISTASYSNGVYFIRIEKDGTIITKKFVKN